MNRSRIKWLITITIFITSAVICSIIFRPKPPLDQLQQARIALMEAEKIYASRYAGMVYADARNSFDSAMHQFQLENGKLFFLRNYKLVEQYSVHASSLAILSAEKTRSAVSDLSQMLAEEIRQQEERLNDYQQIYGTIPLTEVQRNELTRGKILLHEGILAYNNGSYHIAMAKLDSADVMISHIISYSENMLALYFDKYPYWKQQADKSIENSKKRKTTCIIIDKYARTCLLCKNGILVGNYSIELGTNWIGDKNYQGDKSTPEGSYRIVSKKSQGDTRYYKALLLNYPNEDDKKRFLNNKKNGNISNDAYIGSLIEIHGHGGKGTDWTDGCIALKNEDMDSLFRYCNGGNEVIIVGSLKSLDEIMQKTI